MPMNRPLRVFIAAGPWLVAGAALVVALSGRGDPAPQADVGRPRPAEPGALDADAARHLSALDARFALLEGAIAARKDATDGARHPPAGPAAPAPAPEDALRDEVASLRSDVDALLAARAEPQGTAGQVQQILGPITKSLGLTGGGPIDLQNRLGELRQGVRERSDRQRLVQMADALELSDVERGEVSDAVGQWRDTQRSVSARLSQGEIARSAARDELEQARSEARDALARTLGPDRWARAQEMIPELRPRAEAGGDAPAR